MSTTFSIGDVTIHRIVEQEAPFLPALEMFPQLTAEEVEQHRGWLGPKAIDAEGRLLMCFQAYVVKTPHHTVLIDSCIGNDKARGRVAWHKKTDNAFHTSLAAVGVAVEDIDYVMCTHLHADHVGWNTRLEDGRWVPTFPNARYQFAKSEYDHWQTANASSPVVAFVDSVLPVMEAGKADLVSSEHALGDHIRLLPTPGHTPGHVAITVGKGRDDAVMTGDLIHSPLQLRFPDLSPRFDMDGAVAAVTRRAFLERYCGTGTLCCTAHFPAPSVGRIERRGDAFECVMAE